MSSIQTMRAWCLAPRFYQGVIAAGATVSSAAGAVERLVTLRVNGQLRRVDVLKQEALVMTLRYKLSLTGTKIGCDRGECGTCTVLIDGVGCFCRCGDYDKILDAFVRAAAYVRGELT